MSILQHYSSAQLQACRQWSPRARISGGQRSVGLGLISRKGVMLVELPNGQSTVRHMPTTFTARSGGRAEDDSSRGQTRADTAVLRGPSGSK